ncbi:hypothetical protein D3C76_1549310 [compost metagenome]
MPAGTQRIETGRSPLLGRLRSQGLGLPALGIANGKHQGIDAPERSAHPGERGFDGGEIGEIGGKV